MHAGWFAGVKDKDELKNSLQASSFILDKLKKICYNTLYKKDSEVDFEDPNWSHKQAYKIGYNKAIEDISKYLTVSDRET